MAFFTAVGIVAVALIVMGLISSLILAFKPCDHVYKFSHLDSENKSMIFICEHCHKKLGINLQDEVYDKMNDVFTRGR